MVDFRPPTADDITELARTMRDQDVTEMHALGHTDLRSVVQQSVDSSAWSWAVRVNGRLVCIFGLAHIGTLLTPMGAPWMLGTPEVPRQRRNLAKLVPPYIRQMLAETPHLINVVHAHNTVAVRWLTRMGFVMREPAPLGPKGEPFHVFEMSRHV